MYIELGVKIYEGAWVFSVCWRSQIFQNFRVSKGVSGYHKKFS